MRGGGCALFSVRCEVAKERRHVSMDRKHADPMRMEMVPIWDCRSNSKGTLTVSNSDDYNNAYYNPIRRNTTPW